MRAINLGTSEKKLKKSYAKTAKNGFFVVQLNFLIH